MQRDNEGKRRKGIHTSSIVRTSGRLRRLCALMPHDKSMQTHRPSRRVIRAHVLEMYSSSAGMQGTISPDSLQTAGSFS
eukprot:scaffold62815_cov31-Prasinocladus_malaysianus.AAC.2